MTVDLLERTPVVIVTGFLGSGKTTLLNNLLRYRRYGRVAALVNDFGSVNIDAELIAPVADEIVELTNGCVCCTINGNLFEAAERVLALDPPVNRIVVETTGLADPLPVGLTFLETTLRERTSLDAVITVVDSANFVLDLFRSDAAMAQIVHGDVIVLNKIDLVDPDEAASLENRIQVIKPRARVLRAEQGRVPVEAVAGMSALRAGDGERFAATPAADQWFQAVAIDLSGPVSAERFAYWLENELPSEVFRAKGLLRFDHSPEPYLFQLSGSRVSFDPYGRPVEAMSLVFIGCDLAESKLEQSLRACLAERAAA